MSRDFDGVDDKIDFGSDVSIDDFVQRTVLFHSVADVVGGAFASKGKNTALATEGWEIHLAAVLQVNVHIDQAFSLMDGSWRADQAFSRGAVGVVYDRGSANNNPTIYINATEPAFVEAMTPAGDSDTDADQNLRLGAASDDTDFFDGRIGWFVYDSTLFTAAQVNRHRWWGHPGGAVDVYHPLWTDSLINKGTATANGTATGTTMASLPKVERCWGASMGVGR